MENTGAPADPPPNPGEPYPNQPNSHQPPPVSPYARPTDNPAPYPYTAPPTQPYAATPPPPYGELPSYPYAATPPPPYGEPPTYPYAGPPGWPVAPQPARTSKWLIPSIVIFAVVVLGCVTGVGLLVVRAADRAGTAAGADGGSPRLGDLPGGGSSATPLPETDETIPAGPRAATYPVREDDDLARVCDQWYYPTAPKYTGTAAHQISIGVVSDRASKFRSMHPYIDVPSSLGASVRNAWRAENPAKSQLMACVDLVSVGGQLKKCKYTDPKPDTVSLRKGTYQVRLFEVATGRKLVDKKVAGEDEKCPSLVFVGDDKTIYSEPDGRQFYELFRPYVVKKM